MEKFKFIITEATCELLDMKTGEKSIRTFLFRNRKRGIYLNQHIGSKIAGKYRRLNKASYIIYKLEVELDPVELFDRASNIKIEERGVNNA